MEDNTVQNGANQTENQNIENPQVDMIEKAQFDKARSEIAQLKKQLNALRSEEDKAKVEQEEREAELQELRNFKRRSSLENALLKDSGLTASDVSNLAEAIIDGKLENVAQAITSAVKNYGVSMTEKMKQDQLNNTPRPNGATSTVEMTHADYVKMSIDERIALKQSDPQLYAKIK